MALAVPAFYQLIQSHLDVMVFNYTVVE